MENKGNLLLNVVGFYWSFLNSQFSEEIVNMLLIMCETSTGSSGGIYAGIINIQKKGQKQDRTDKISGKKKCVLRCINNN